MTVLGIVAEYDPFHNGHLYHLREAMRRVRPDYTVVVLSPCLKQRGAFALLSPTCRASLALEAGADAVFSLPVLWTVRDAEHYALGAVSLLSSLGATHLAFGAEANDLALLSAVAALLESPTAGFQDDLKSRLAGGQGYPAALSAAVGQAIPETAGLLDRPNNVLAVCYLRALYHLGSGLAPVVIRRTGAYLSPEIDAAAPSASALRAALDRGVYGEAFAAVPPYTESVLRRCFLDRRVPDPDVEDVLLLGRLRTMSRTDYAALPDVSEGLDSALRRAADQAVSREELLRLLTGVRYPAARISRLCACALLGVTREDTDSLPLPENGLLLGLRRGSGISVFWKGLPFPIVSSFTEWKKAAHPADLRAWSLWGQCCRLPDTLPFTEKIVTLP